MPSKGEVNLFQLHSKSISYLGVYGIQSTSSGLLTTTLSKYNLIIHTLFVTSVSIYHLYRCYANYKYITPESTSIVIQMANIFLLITDLVQLGMTVCFTVFRTQLVCTWNQLMRLSLLGN